MTFYRPITFNEVLSLQLLVHVNCRTLLSNPHTLRTSIDITLSQKPFYLQMGRLQEDLEDEKRRMREENEEEIARMRKEILEREDELRALVADVNSLNLKYLNDFAVRAELLFQCSLL